MSLRYALLALLTAQPMTGYDLAKAFHSSVGHVWHAPDSQIYPELKRMQRENLIDGRTVLWGSKGEKTEYSITTDGTEAFREWMSTPLEYTRERNPAHLRAAYFEWADSPAICAQLEAHIANYSMLRDQWREQLRTIRDQTHPIFAKRLEANPEEDWPRITAFKLFTYEGLVAQADQEIAWAERGLRLVEQLDASEPAPPTH